jgi:hypothetical protein
MTVRELLELLEDCDEDAEVRIMMQENWPFECAIDGIALREDMAGDEPCDCDRRITEPHEVNCPAADEGEYADGLKGSDVFIVEGRQERYGNKDAWVVSRRR